MPALVDLFEDLDAIYVDVSDVEEVCVDEVLLFEEFAERIGFRAGPVPCYRASYAFAEQAETPSVHEFVSEREVHVLVLGNHGAALTAEDQGFELRLRLVEDFEVGLRVNTENVFEIIDETLPGVSQRFLEHLLISEDLVGTLALACRLSAFPFCRQPCAEVDQSLGLGCFVKCRLGYRGFLFGSFHKQVRGNGFQEVDGLDMYHVLPWHYGVAERIILPVVLSDQDAATDEKCQNILGVLFADAGYQLFRDDLGYFDRGAAELQDVHPDISYQRFA